MAGGCERQKKEVGEEEEEGDEGRCLKEEVVGRQAAVELVPKKQKLRLLSYFFFSFSVSPSFLPVKYLWKSKRRGRDGESLICGSRGEGKEKKFVGSGEAIG